MDGAGGVCEERGCVEGVRGVCGRCERCVWMVREGTPMQSQSPPMQSQVDFPNIA